jgi:hypothetical protein
MTVSFVGKTLIAIVSLCLSAGISSASVCSIPEFNPQQHTYISSTLEQDAHLHDELAGLSDELVSTGNANGHQIIPYFVACQMNYQDGVPGVDFVHAILEDWQKNADFPAREQVVIIAWVRNGFDTRHGSVGATGDQKLQDLGFSGDYFAADDGPVLGDIRSYMPDNPKSEFVHIIHQVGDDIDAQKARARQDAIDSADEANFLKAAWKFCGGLLAFCLVAWLVIRLWKANLRKEMARDSIRKKDGVVTLALQWVDSDFKTLEKQGFCPSAHVTALTTLRQRQEKLHQQMRSNPEANVAVATTLMNAAEQLKSEVSNSLKLQTHTLPTLELGVDHVFETAVLTRHKVVSYAFPDVATPAGVTTFFELRAKGGNPDEEIALAHQSIDAAKRSLAKGNVDESQTHCDAADAHIKNANAIIEDTLAARVGVGATITNIEQARAQLLSDCESGNEPLQQLKSDFASVNFQDVAKNIETAKTTARKVEGVIAQAAAQYFKQDFLAAKKLLDDLLHDLTAAKTGVGQISLRLNELTEKRAKLLANVAKTGGTLETVGAKLQSNSSYVSSTTKSNYEKLQQQQKSLSQVSEGGSAINWLAMYMLWEAFNSGASTVSSHIDSDRSSYEASQRASEAAAASAASSYTTSSFSIDTSSSSSMGGSGGGNY